MAYSINAEANLHLLYSSIVSNTYAHSYYEQFLIRDPKLRNISKASVNDRVIHQYLFDNLEPLLKKVLFMILTVLGLARVSIGQLLGSKSLQKDYHIGTKELFLF